MTSETAAIPSQTERHPRAFNPGTLALTILLSVVGAIIGMQTLTTLGITPNTSIIGVLFAIGVSRVPGLRGFRSVHRQNLLQTNIYSATFGAANSLLLPIGVPVLLGRPDLIPAMLLGATMGMLIDLAMLYWFFDSRILVALVQAVLLVMRGRGRAAPDRQRTGFTRSDGYVRSSLVWGTGLYLAAALLLSGVGGLWTTMPPSQILGWIAFAAFACIAAEFIVGFSAMQAGWFPAFSTALIFLMLGLILGFPPPAAALLVGFVASGGPAFADAGYDFKTGWRLRGDGVDPAFELEGRRQQLFAGLIGLAIAFVLVALFHDLYFSRNLFPPIDRVFAATIESGIDPSIVRSLAIWAVPGALLQMVGGPDRQLGILFGTGLLILNPAAGWAVLAGIAVRLILHGRRRVTPETTAVFGAGAIAGDALWAFGSSVVRAW